MSLILAVFISFLVTLTLVPIIIRVSKSIDVLDQPDTRKIHSISTPSMGGIAIFVGFALSLMLALSFLEIANQKYFLGATLLVFLLGIRDDLSSLKANHKLVVQVFAAAMVVFFMDIKIHGLNGLFGIYSFGWYFDELFTISVIAILTNAFNLIDGIDGLAGSIGLLISLTFSVLFYQLGNLTDAIIAISLSGGILAFLIYNWYPSKVFMGDTGSMVLGFSLTVLFIRFLDVPSPVSGYISPVALVLSLFILPVYDSLRVFIIRFLSGKHPLSPDRNHIHHVLLKLGYHHGEATTYLVSFNVLIFFSVFSLQFIGELWLILSMAVITITIGVFLDHKVMKREARMARMVSSDMKMAKTA